MYDACSEDCSGFRAQKMEGISPLGNGSGGWGGKGWGWAPEGGRSKVRVSEQAGIVMGTAEGMG